MPCRTEEIENHQLLVDVCLTPDMPTAQRRFRQGKFKPGVDSLRALLDTGATGSAISSETVDSLKLTPLKKIPVMTGAGKIETWVYRVNIHPVVMEGDNSHVRHHINVEVIEFPAGDDFDVILGMDLISRGALHVACGHFTFCI